MQRTISSASLQLLDPDLDEWGVFDPPARRPGRFLQFTDISLHEDDELDLRSVSWTTDRVVPGLENISGDFADFRLSTERDSLSSSLVLQMNDVRPLHVLSPSPSPSQSPSEPSSPRHQGVSGTNVPFLLSRRRVAMLVTSCLTVSLTALTLVNFVL